MRLYAVSGIGADERVFQRLTLDAELLPVSWVDPCPAESIAEYARRLSDQIDTSEPYGIIGLCFGGVVAVELSKLLSPQLTILLSSPETKDDLPLAYRLVGRLNIIKHLPAACFKPPRIICHWIFGVKQTAFFDRIIASIDSRYVRWALQAMISWDNTVRPPNTVLKIGGSGDIIMPQNPTNTQMIAHCGHMITLDRPRETSKIINRYLHHIARSTTII